MRCPGRSYADTLRRFDRSLCKGLVDPTAFRAAKTDCMSGGIRHMGGISRVLVLRTRRPLVSPPLVICREPWVRRNPEWHCDPSYRVFCWVLPRAWREHFAARAMCGVDTRVLAKDAATWMLSAMAIQLSRHWISFERGWYEWPAEWEDYSHDEEGVREYIAGTIRKR